MGAACVVEVVFKRRPLFACCSWQVRMFFETMDRVKDEDAATWQFVDKFEFDVGGPVCIKASTA